MGFAAGQVVVYCIGHTIVNLAQILKYKMFDSACRVVFSPEFTGRRAQIISHDHTHHLECSDCHYQTFVVCVPLPTKHFVQFSVLYSEPRQF